MAFLVKAGTLRIVNIVAMVKEPKVREVVGVSWTPAILHFTTASTVGAMKVSQTTEK